MIATLEMERYSLTEEDLCYYDSNMKALRGSQVSKARKFNKEGCIEYIGMNRFVCKPIIGYNKTAYVLERWDFGEKWDFGWRCNCQHFMKDGMNCSHLLALFLWMKLRGEENE